MLQLKAAPSAANADRRLRQVQLADRRADYRYGLRIAPSGHCRQNRCPPLVDVRVAQFKGSLRCTRHLRIEGQKRS